MKVMNKSVVIFARKILTYLAAVVLAVGVGFLSFNSGRVIRVAINRLAGVTPTVDSRVKAILEKKPWIEEAAERAAGHLDILVFKQEQIVELYSPGWALPRTYKMTAFSGRLGPKLKEGDLQIPEGIYSIEYLNPNSSFYLSLKVSYPNEFDKAKAEKVGRKNLGGDIMIHGEDATVGCIPIGNDAIEDVFALVAKIGKDKVKVVISPYDMRHGRKDELEKSGIVWYKELCDNIHDELKKTRLLELSEEEEEISKSDMLEYKEDYINVHHSGYDPDPFYAEPDRVIKRPKGASGYGMSAVSSGSMCVQAGEKAPDPPFDIAKAMLSEENLRDFFRDHRIYDVEYVKLSEYYHGFPWIKLLGHSNQENPSCAIEAEMYFEAEGRSSVPKNLILSLKAELENNLNLETKKAEEGEDTYYAEMQSLHHFAKFYVRSYEIGESAPGKRKYTIGFHICRGTKQYVVRHDQGFGYWGGFTEVVHVTKIGKAELENEGKWKYEVIKGKSSEELLDEWIKNRDKSILKVGQSEVGMCVGWGKGNASVCPEWEATDYAPFVGAYLRQVDLETQRRLYAKLCCPDKFTGKKRTKTEKFTVGDIFWEVIPGDEIVWYQEDRRLIGTVVAEGEEGEFWEPIKAKVKVTEVLFAATKEDWQPTPLTLVYEKELRKVEKYSCLSSWSTDYVEKAKEGLRFCAENIKRGCYHVPMIYSISDGQYRSREYARNQMRWRERETWIKLQYEYNYVRTRLLDHYFGYNYNYGKNPKPDDEECREFGMTRFERMQSLALPGWRALERQINKECPRRHYTFTTGYRTFEEKVAYPTLEEKAEHIKRLNEIAKNRDFAPDYANELDILDAFEICLDYPEHARELEDLQTAAIKAMKKSGSSIVESMFYKLVMEYGNESVVWDILEKLDYKQDSQYFSKMRRLMLDSFWHKFSRGEYKGIVPPAGMMPQADEILEAGYELTQIVNIPHNDTTNNYVYIYKHKDKDVNMVEVWNDGDERRGMCKAVDDKIGKRSEDAKLTEIRVEDNPKVLFLWLKWEYSTTKAEEYEVYAIHRGSSDVTPTKFATLNPPYTSHTDSEKKLLWKSTAED